MMMKLIAVIAVVVLTGCAATGSNMLVTDDGTQFSSNYLRAAAIYDGVNGNLFVIKIPKLNQFGKPIKEVDPETGELAVTYARVEYKFVSDEPIGGQLVTIGFTTTTDLLAGMALTKFSHNLNGGSCKGSGCGGGAQIINVNELISSSGARITSGCGPAGCGGWQ